MDRTLLPRGWICARFICPATLFACGAGDGNRTRTVSLGRVLILPCFRVLQRYWRPQLASCDPYRPGLVARVWPGSLGSRVENRALAQSSPGRGSPRPNRVSHYRGCETATLPAGWETVGAPNSLGRPTPSMR